ncbi:MAG: glycoside hydrolase, partial [Thermoplasmata archaeon]|nr:glycoside hydrolase [Thermoplasmata archaeon]
TTMPEDGQAPNEAPGTPVDGTPVQAPPAPEAEPEVVSISVEAQPASPPPSPAPARRSPLAPILANRKLLAVGVVAIVVLAGTFAVLNMDDDDDDDGGSPYIPPDSNVTMPLVLGEPVMLKRAYFDPLGFQDIPDGVIGYEPSLAVDSNGNMFYTAHKDLEWETSWDYLASWWFISDDGGQTWRDPSDMLWNTVGKTVWAGDEGDIAIDANDWIYYVDTILVDNNFHVFSNGGDTYEYSKEHGTTQLDDRPWLTAQGDRILHYLGNNGVSMNGAREIYYRSEDGGLTWTTGEPMVGGWATIDAERFGEHVYIAQVYSDGSEQNIIMYASDDMGYTWSGPNEVGPMVNNGVGEGMPTVFHGNNGTVFVTWQDSPQGGNASATLYLARSDDYGMTFEHWNISMPEGAVYLYPTVNVCQYGEYHERNRLGISFYGTTDVPVTADSVWYLYAAVAEDPRNGSQFYFQRIDPEPLVTTDDLHALHDFFEIVIAPDGSLNIAYQRNIGSHPIEAGEEQRYLMFVRAEVVDEGS